MDSFERLQSIVDDTTSGNKKKFAELAGINKNTMQNYMRGRPPKADALEKICNTYNVNLNWLVAGKGEKYLDQGVQEESQGRKINYISLIERWLLESSEKDSRIKIWFEMQFEKKFPEFTRWLGGDEEKEQKVA